jgi:hypothetical protein
MQRLTLLAVLSAGVCLPALSQETWDVWETKWTGDATAVLAPDAGQEALYRLDLGFDTNRVLDNGLELGLVMNLGAELDNGARSGFSGIVVDPAPGSPGLTGAFSGLAQADGREDTGARGVLQTAYVYAEGGYGEVRIGRDEGVAKRLSEGAPSLFSTLSLHAPKLDPDGGAIVRTDHDLTGPAAKVSFTTPRIIGLKGGVSFTPEADVRGLDRDPARILPGTPAFSLSNAAEASVSFNHRFRKSGVRVRAATAYSRADVDAAPTSPVAYGTVQTWSAGASAEWKDTVFGASWLNSDNGLDGRPGDYKAWTAGITHTAFGLDWGAEYGEATDDSAGVEGESWRAGIAKSVNENARIALGYRYDSLDSGAFATTRRLGGRGIVLEITLSR